MRLENGSTPVYTHGDHLGSAVAATDAAGAVLWREQYTPYGEKLENPAANDNNTGYTGHLEDDATDLTYMQARYFDPVIGRFLSTDPIGYQDQTNLYAYVGNDPVNKFDPNGESALSLAVKFVVKGGDIGATFAGVADDIKTLRDPNAGGLTKAIAVVSLASEALSPVSLKDVKAGAAAAKKIACFEAGTLVLTSEGKRAIEDIAVGDMVWSRDPETGVEGWRKVAETFINDESTVWNLSLDDPAQGKSVVHRVTGEHPYWVLNAANDNAPGTTAAWVEVSNLQPGMQIATASENILTVIAANDTGIVNRTYNFEVEEFHTYFVGDEQVLVHNNCKGKGVDKFADRREPKSIQDKMTLDAAKEGQGTTIIPADEIGDPKFQGMEKASLNVKSKEGKESVVNYMRDPETKEGTDFKFKKRSDE